MDYGADINIINCTPLKLANSNNHIGTVEYLLENGANLIDCINSLVDTNIEKNNIDMVRIYSRYFSNFAEIINKNLFIYSSIFCKKLDMLKLFVEYGGCLNYPLYFITAIISEDTEILKFLVNNGALIPYDDVKKLRKDLLDKEILDILYELNLIHD